MSDKILSVAFEGREICTFDHGHPHGEHWPSAQAQTAHPELVFADSRGTRRVFDLSFVRDERKDWVHFCIRVSSEYLVQPDLVFGESSEDPEQAFRAGEVSGVRLQPFILPESSKSYDVIEGRGLFQRGFHFVGIVTPGNVSLVCVCAYCDRNFRIQSFHAGMSNVAYFYCSDCTETLVASVDLEDAPPVLEEADPAALKRFEQRLPYAPNAADRSPITIRCGVPIAKSPISTSDGSPRSANSSTTATSCMVVGPKNSTVTNDGWRHRFPARKTSEHSCFPIPMAAISGLSIPIAT